jgi:hypothetical protein
LSTSDFVAEVPKNSYIEAQTDALQFELLEVETEVKGLCSSLPRPQSKARSQLSEEVQLLAEIRSNSYSKEFMLPHKAKDTPNTTSLAVRKDLPYDDLCSVFGNADFEDDDLLCSVRPTQLCSLTTHQKCYDIPSAFDIWVCDVCVTFGKIKRHSVPCALCPIKGGALKATVHTNDGTLGNYTAPRKRLRDDGEKPEYPRQVLVHVFCALNIEGVKVPSLEERKVIDVSLVDKRKFTSVRSVRNVKEPVSSAASPSACSVPP